MQLPAAVFISAVVTLLPLCQSHNDDFEYGPRNPRLERFRVRSKRQIVGRSCQFSTDCSPGGYCDDRKVCRCLSTFVSINNGCIRKINPDESGCSNQRQCNSVSPGASCQAGVCKCANSQPAFQTRDGPVCVNYGFCPVNGQYTKLRLNTGSDATCTAGMDSTCNQRTYECFCATSDCTGTAFCCPGRALACIMPVDAGSTPNSGGGGVSRYYYDSTVGACRTFSYRGANGNANNFETQEQCESYCMQSCPRGQPDYNNFVPGVSVKESRKFCTGSGSGQCNSNFECTRPVTADTSLCCPKVSYVCSKSGGAPNTGVATNYDPGLSGGTSVTVQRWYFDASSQTCQSFTYLGQGGNYNNFISQTECESFCAQVNCPAGEPLKDINGISNKPCTQGCPSTHTCTNSVVCCPTKQYLCGLTVASGGGFTAIPRFFYNSATRNCQQFTYTGAGGNDNNFLTYDACTTFCQDVAGGVSCPQGDPVKDSSGNVLQCNQFSGSVFSSVTTYTCQPGYVCTYDASTRASGCCPTKTTTCSQSFDTGSRCGPTVTRWYYNQVNARCDSFTYNGCDGNSNNFATKSDCDNYCGGGGCPDGGEPARSTSTGSYITCGGTSFCPAQHTCSPVTLPNFNSVSTQNLCCPSKEYICSQPRLTGQLCGSGSVVRYFFNTITKNCESFSYGGCSGNRNNFQTIVECQNYCNSAGCPTGQIVQSDAVSGILATCSPGGSNGGFCTSNFNCVFSQLLGRGVCCGSNAPADQCPSGQIAYIDPATQQTMTCAVNTVNACPSGFSCYYSPSQRNNACCGTAVVQCPQGGTPYLDPTTNGPRQCTPGYSNACPAGVTCQATPVTIIGVRSTTGYCCGAGANYCGNGFQLATMPGSPGVPIQCQLNVPSTCPSPSLCRQSTSSTSFGSTGAYCCLQTTTISVNVCVAFPNETPYVVSSAPVICNAAFDPTRCPPPYQCRPYAPNNNYYCCQPGNAQPPPVTGGCPPGYNPLLSGGQKVRCSNSFANPSCPSPNVCQYSSADRGFICCTNGAIVVQPTVRCPNGQAPYTNPTNRQAQTCSMALAGRVQQCPAGNVCQAVGARGYCCPGAFQPTQAPASTDGCPAGSTAMLYPGTSSPLGCNGVGSPCPGAYQCVASVRYVGRFQCCRVNRSGRQRRSVVLHAHEHQDNETCPFE